MLSLFRTNQFFANAFLIIYVLVIWSPVLFLPQDIVLSDGTILFDSINSYLPEPGSIPNYLIAAILTLLQAILINVIVSQYRITEEITLFPGVFYILFMGFSSQFWITTPLLFANFFLLFAILELISTYKEYSSADRIFNIGLFIGIASLFYFSYIVFLIFAWIAIGILRAINWKERLILIFGFLVPYFFVFTYHYWYDMQHTFFSNEILSNFKLLNFDNFRGFQDIATSILVGIMLLISLFSYKLYTYKKKIKIQKIVDILYWVIAASALSILFQNQINIQHYQMLLPILAIFVSINFVNMSKQWSEVWHMLLISGLLILHFVSFLNI